MSTGSGSEPGSQTTPATAVASCAASRSSCATAPRSGAALSISTCRTSTPRADSARSAASTAVLSLVPVGKATSQVPEGVPEAAWRTGFQVTR